MIKIKQEISKDQSGWQAKEVMDIIYKKTGINYHEVHIYRLLLHKWGFTPKVPHTRFVNTASSKEEKKGAFKKGVQESLRKSQMDSQ